jgi:hypothetical protein
MKTQHPNNITTEAEAKAWLDELIKNDEIYNPDDDEHDIFWGSLPKDQIPDEKECDQMKHLMNQVCSFDFDPHEYILNQTHPEWDAE